MTRPNNLKLIKTKDGFQVQAFYRKPYGAKVLFAYQRGRKLIFKNPFKRPGDGR